MSVSKTYEQNREFQCIYRVGFIKHLLLHPRSDKKKNLLALSSEERGGVRSSALPNKIGPRGIIHQKSISAPAHLLNAILHRRKKSVR